MTQKPVHRLIAKVATGFRPPPDMTVGQWAEDNRVLSGENCAIPGPYRVAVTPFLAEILDCVTQRQVDKLVCMKSAQVAWTDGVINNVVGYHIDQDACPMLILFPTDNLAQRYSKEKLTPMVRDTPALTQKVAPSKSRDAGNTIHSKNFPGGHLELVASNSPANLSSSPIRLIIVEEPDRCSSNSGKEGDSIKLVIERGKTFHNRKIILGGSPTTGHSNIEREFLLSDQRHYYIPCPHCDGMQTLEWSMVQWDSDPGRCHDIYGDYAPETARLLCKHCEEPFTNAQKNRALANGEWRAHAEFNGVAGFFISELYSPFPKATLKDVVEKFLEANHYLKKGDNTLMITFTNTSLGQTWKEVGDSVDEDPLYARREVYGPEVPIGACLLTAGVDVQGDRLEVEVVAWGPGKESWSLEYEKFHGDPTKTVVWQRLDDFLKKPRLHESGVALHILGVGVDSGYLTTDVYEFCQPRWARGVFAVKGKGGAGIPLASNPTNKAISDTNNNKVKIYTVGVDGAKDTLYGSRLNPKVTKEPGPGFCHFPIHYTQEYFHQLTGEEKINVMKMGRKVGVWRPKSSSRRVEVLDCRIYATAAVQILNADLDAVMQSVVAAEQELKHNIPAPRPRRRRVLHKGVEL